MSQEIFDWWFIERPHQLPYLSRLVDGLSSGAAINNNGRVVDTLQTRSGQSHAFSWTASGSMVDLRTRSGTASSALAAQRSGHLHGATQ